jgi:hypothetical protein
MGDSYTIPIRTTKDFEILNVCIHYDALFSFAF